MVKNALRRKLLRDMWKNRMQFVAVILLCALGTWVFTGLDASWRMIDLSANTYFKQQNLADLWVTLPNVDHAAEYRLQNLAGVSGVNLRATVDLETDLPGEPILLVTAYDGEMDINQPLLYEGEQLARNDRRGCLLDRMFALENGLQPGDSIGLKLGGETHRFTIRGLCLSPEYTALSKDALPDHASYGFVLINASALPALPLNSAVLTLAEGAESDTVEKAVLALHPEALILNHASHSATHGVGKDVDMFRNLSYLFPLLAYAVAAMIVLTTITRMLENQRMQMGTLKALGYRDGQLLRHYLSYAFYPSLVGSVMGMVVGRITLPYILWALEEVQFSLPYQLQAPVSAGQWGMCVLGVVLSCTICFHTYRKSAQENTAQLLRPKPPKAGKKLLLERCGFVWRRIGFNAKMVVRNLFRNKARTLMSLMGVLCCNALIISSLGLQDSVTFFVGKYYYGTVQYTLRADLTAQAGEIDSYRKRIGAEALEGVMEVSLSARTDSSGRTTVLSVFEDGQRLMHFGENETWVELPQKGVMLSQKLAQTLDAQVGDRIELWLPGDDEPIVTEVGGIAWVTVGQSAMMRRSEWESHNKTSFVPTGLLIRHPTEEGMRRLNELDELDELHDPDLQYVGMLRILDSMTQVFWLMSVAALGLAFVVLYNMGMLNYMERYREYATLKVMGYHQKEIRRLITSENDLLAVIGILISLWPGRWLTAEILRLCENDTMVFASTVRPQSFVIACVVTYLFSRFVTFLLTRKVRKVDMVEALKSVE